MISLDMKNIAEKKNHFTAIISNFIPALGQKKICYC